MKRNADKKLVFVDGHGTRRDISITPIGSDTTEVSEHGAQLFLTPLALRLPTGRHRFIGSAIHAAVGGGTTYIGRGSATNFVPAAWLMGALPACEFGVLPNRVCYIGRVGVLSRQVEYEDRTKRDTACEPQHRAANTCHFEQFFLGSAPEHDVALIKRRYPKLAAWEVNTSLARSPQDGWGRWPQVLQSVPTTPSSPRMLPVT